MFSGPSVLWPGTFAILGLSEATWGSEVSTPEIFKDLNPEQLKAVKTTEGPLLVVAGAGSGKTRVLTYRIAYLVGVCGIPPEQIIAVTFTNKAAREMQERGVDLLGPDSKGTWVSTFHSTCVRILRREINHLGRARGFVIYDEADSLGTLKESLKLHGLDPKGHDARRLRWRIDQWKNAGELPHQAAESATDLEAEQSAEVYASYQRLLLDANALDFGDLLLLTAMLFRNHPEVLGHYQDRWAYVLIDEYQDTNRVQYELVNALTSKHRNLCVVGDPDQSVYAWRGADIRNILDFERDYADANVVVLDRNYRSTQAILSGAGAVVANNVDRPEKEMKAERGKGEQIHFYRAENERDEAAHVIGNIISMSRENDRVLSDFAIFYRTNAQSRPLEEELLKYDVPYVVVGGTRFYDRAEVKDILAYLRLLVNPADSMALRRIINKPPRGIGKTTILRAEAIAQRDEISLLEALRLYSDQENRTGKNVRTFFQLLESMSESIHDVGPEEALGLVLDKTGYIRHLERANTPESEMRIENLRELVAGAGDFEFTNLEEGIERPVLELFLDQVALVTDLDNVDGLTERVSLMSAHSAKGLEFPVVHLVGMEEGLFPHAASSRDHEAIEEERRLCYVGMTRAMEHLTLTWAEERRRFGGREIAIPSRFLSEVPDHLHDGPSPEDSFRGPAAAYGGERSLDYEYGQLEPDAGASAGVRVRHAIFGEGVILKSIGSGPKQKLRIRFDRAGVKTVVTKFANLEFF